MLPRKVTRSAVLALLLASCTTLGLHKMSNQPHVSFVVPSPQASYDERLAAYQKLRPETERKGLFFKTDVPKKRKRANDPLKLSDGTNVYHSEDLAGLVLPDSVTAQAIQRHLKFEQEQRVWGSSAIGLGALSSSGVSLGTFIFARGDDKQAKSLGVELAIGSIVLGAIGVAVAIPVANARGELAQKANEDAFVNYDPALRLFLGICQKDDKLVDCYATEPDSQPIRESLKDRFKKRFSRGDKKD